MHAALRDLAPDAELRLVHTEQHYDESMSAVFFDELGLPRPDESLGVGSGSHAEQTARALVAVERSLIELAPGPRRRRRRRQLDARRARSPR